MTRHRPHVLGVDDGSFDKGQHEPVPIVGVLMEGHNLMESVALTRFPVDGDGVTEFLAKWIAGLRLHPSLQGVVLGGITIVGLGVIDVPALAGALGVPVLVVTRRDPAQHRLDEALRAAGLTERIEIVARAAPAFQAEAGVWLAHEGIERDAAHALLRATRGKSKLPEALRVAHLIGRALVSGESRGRV